MANAAQYLDLIAARGRVDLESLVHRIGGVNFRVSMEIFEDAAKLGPPAKCGRTCSRTAMGSPTRRPGR